MASFLLKLTSGFNTPFNVINMVINTRKGAILLNPIKIRATGEIKAGRIDNMSIIRINPTVTASLFSRFSKTADLRLPTWGKFFRRCVLIAKYIPMLLEMIINTETEQNITAITFECEFLWQINNYNIYRNYCS